MTRQLHRATLARLAVRMGLGAMTAVGVVALAVPAGASSVALALGAGGLIAMSGLGGERRRRPRVTAPRRV